MLSGRYDERQRERGKGGGGGGEILTFGLLLETLSSSVVRPC